MENFIIMSKYAGMREDLVQAGGGNSSYKLSSEEMAIKASGYQLADVTETEGYAVVNPAVIRDEFLNADHLEDLTEEYCNQILAKAFLRGKRPSIETFLHAISGKYTLHTHPVVVNAITCRTDGLEILRTLFPEALLVPYAKPGAELAKKYFSAYKAQAISATQTFDITFLQNHGLVISADTAEAVIDRTEEVVCRLEKYLGADFSAYHNVTRIWEQFPDKIVWRVTDHHVLDAYHQYGLWPHVFCPDCVVFLGKSVLQLPQEEQSASIQEFCSVYGEPTVVECQGALYILADSVKKALETQSVLSFSAQVMVLNHGKACKLLSEKEQNELLNWDAEKYRKNLK